jgi:hypothetical protein
MLNRHLILTITIIANQVKVGVLVTQTVLKTNNKMTSTPDSLRLLFNNIYNNGNNFHNSKSIFRERVASQEAVSPLAMIKFLMLQCHKVRSKIVSFNTTAKTSVKATAQKNPK